MRDRIYSRLQRWKSRIRVSDTLQRQELFWRPPRIDGLRHRDLLRPLPRGLRQSHAPFTSHDRSIATLRAGRVLLERHSKLLQRLLESPRVPRATDEPEGG